MHINDKILLLAKNLMIADGLVPSGKWTYEEYPKNTVESILEHQSAETKRRSKRRYRKMKKFMKKRYPHTVVGGKIRMAHEIKIHYIRKAAKLLNER